MKKTLLLLLLKFVAITLPLTYWWMGGGRELYFRAFLDLARPILILLDVVTFPVSVVNERFLSVVPFVALMIATPNLSWRRRVLGFAGGMVGIFVSQVLLTYWAHECFVPDGRTPESMGRFFPAMMLADATPFMLWAFIANSFIVDLLSRVMPKSATAQPAASAGAPSRSDDEEGPPVNEP